MGAETKIQWAHSTFNPWIGCTKVSPGCKNCYAEALMDKRWGRVQWGAGKPRERTSEKNWRDPISWNRVAEKSGERHRVFCASLADWLDPEVDAEWLVDLLSLIARTPALTWMLLSKRPQLWKQRMLDVLTWCEECPWDELTTEVLAARDLARNWQFEHPPANVWIGTTVEDQQRADERIPHLMAIPARIHFLSIEPLLGSVHVPGYFERGRTGSRTGYPDWWIVGGESGHGSRFIDPAWVRALRDQCKSVGASFFFKQWSGLHPKDLGRELDGREWNEVPE